MSSFPKAGRAWATGWGLAEHAQKGFVTRILPSELRFCPRNSGQERIFDNANLSRIP